ncbi:MAG: alpha/beta hydrolase family protein [Psychrobacter sp.]
MIVSKSTTAINNKSSSSTHQSVSITTGKPVMLRCLLSVAIASSLLLVGCGDDNDFDTVIGSDSATSVKSISSFNTAQINTQFDLDGTATPDAKCDIKIEKVSYPTVGAAGERTNATAALMLPSGDSADCQGERPILLYAHGTTTDKGYDFSQVANPQNPAAGESTLIAANFAAQGYIVVAPNYAGYDDSDLDYHPYLVAEQQATDMADALDSARTIIARQQRANDPDYTNLDDSGKLFISGYSQGGHVAMATARMFEKNDEPVTAIAPLSGPYALAAFGDAIFSGNVNIGASRFAPLLASGLQNAYGNVYNNTADIFTANYANTQLPSLLSFGELVAANKLPDNALFEKDPENNPTLDLLPAPTVPFASIGFADDNYLIKTDFRAAYVADTIKHPDGLMTENGNKMPAVAPENNLRKALKDNDLRGYVPTMPTLICGGNQDPTVYFDTNTGSMVEILQAASDKNFAKKLNITVLDVDKDNAAERPDKSTFMMIGEASMNKWNATDIVTNVQTNFSNSVEKVKADATAQGGVPLLAFYTNYHGGLVSPACTQATREFFNQEFKPA